MAKKGCRKPDEHSTLHMCSLKGKKIGPELAKLFSDPKFVCANCGIRVNRAENVCNPKPF
jgi:transposase